MDDRSSEPPAGWQPPEWRSRLDRWLDETETEIRGLVGEPQSSAADLPLTTGLPSQPDPAAAWAAEPRGGFDLIPLVQAFTALRHELKLQTKAARGQQEAFQAALADLGRVAGELRTLPRQERLQAEQLARPLVVALLDLSDSFRRTIAAWQASTAGIPPSTPASQWLDLVRRQRAELGWLGRRFAGPALARIEAAAQQQAEAADAARLASARLLEGLQLVDERLARTLRDQQIQAIDAVGRPLDPHCMQAVEVVHGSDAAPGTVVDEVRPGYRWGDQVVRFAEVRVAGAAH